MNLYEISQEIENCVKMPSGDTVNTETGELIDTEALENLKMARDEKIENIALWIKNLLSNAEAIKAEIGKMKSRMDSETRKAESLKNYLNMVLVGKKFESPKCKISYRKSQSLEFDDDFISWAEENADSLLKFCQPDIDKKAVKEAIKNGIEIEHAKMVEKQNMQIK